LSAVAISTAAAATDTVATPAAAANNDLTIGTELDLASEAAPDVTSAVVADFKRWMFAKGEDLRHKTTLQRTNMVDDVVKDSEKLVT
jgi:hypothetical protein